MTITKEFAEVNDGKLYYELSGEGEAILFIHGLFLDSKLWDKQFYEFSKTNKVIRLDLRGFGHTEITEKSFSNFDDLKALLEYLNIDKVHIVGLSLGSLIALEFALVYPEFVESLVLCSMKLSRDESPALQNARRDFWSAYQSGDMYTCVNLSEQLWLQGQGPAGITSAENRILYREMIESNLSKPKIKSKPIFLENIEKKLDDIKVRTLIVSGELDFEDYRLAAGELCEKIKGSEKISFEKSAHLMNLNEPVLFNRTIAEFISKTQNS
ncbi:alpha/beta hydrolase [Anaerobacillus alkaliphilus]|uniref:Alpha/beta hydrolase n=1 Tax=Anaerobacillus alkaliphilus TaxID=1548597 RepID=A0A4Q0VS87_9BACI|nr:alpha/beta hydrolase [Anaerobacillus alkaliphilus]RXJ00659.1 alpha/beta hydrolase [Anaerobacillus alkaliphilus]